MDNARELKTIRKGQYPTFRQTSSHYPAALPFVLCRGFLFSSLVPNLGIPLLFWRMESKLKNGYSLWVPRNFERDRSKKLVEFICINALPLLNSIGPSDIRIKMRKHLCFSRAGLKQRWVFDASCIANYKVFDSVKHQCEIFWGSITQEFDSNNPLSAG